MDKDPLENVVKGCGISCAPDQEIIGFGSRVTFEEYDGEWVNTGAGLVPVESMKLEPEGNATENEGQDSQTPTTIFTLERRDDDARTQSITFGAKTPSATNDQDGGAEQPRLYHPCLKRGRLLGYG